MLKCPLKGEALNGLQIHVSLWKFLVHGMFFSKQSNFEAI